MARFTLDATKVVAIAAVGLTLTGCTAFRTAIGATKNPPDEFTVVTKAPLVIPPDFNLRPPQPGAAAATSPILMRSRVTRCSRRTARIRPQLSAPSTARARSFSSRAPMRSRSIPTSAAGSPPMSGKKTLGPISRIAS